MKLKYKKRFTLDPRLHTMKTGGIKYMCDVVHPEGPHLEGRRPETSRASGARGVGLWP